MNKVALLSFCCKIVPDLRHGIQQLLINGSFFPQILDFVVLSNVCPLYVKLLSFALVSPQVSCYVSLARRKGLGRKKYKQVEQFD